MTPMLPKVRRAVFIGLALLSLGVRLPQLGSRPMHTDEAINAYITGQLLAGKAFHYDPRDRHGPVLYLLAKPIAELQGAKGFSDLTESELRLTPVLAGVATVLLSGLGVEMFGLVACVVAAALLTIAPLPVYYNRYFIHETLFVSATLGLLISGWNAWERGRAWPAALAGVCAALMLACKETAVIHFFGFGVALVCVSLLKPGGKFPPVRVFAISGVIFLLTSVLLFTWFGRNWQALADLARAVPSFAARAEGQGHEKPFWYFAGLLAGGWSGAAILVLAGIGFIRAIRRRERPSF